MPCAPNTWPKPTVLGRHMSDADDTIGLAMLDWNDNVRPVLVATYQAIVANAESEQPGPQFVDGAQINAELA